MMSSLLYFYTDYVLFNHSSQGNSPVSQGNYSARLSAVPNHILRGHRGGCVVSCCHVLALLRLLGPHRCLYTHGILLLGSGVRKYDSSGDRDNPSKTFQHDGVVVQLGGGLR